MRDKRVVQFLVTGLLAALVLQSVGYFLDHSRPRLALEELLVFNWLNLLFAPVSFLARLANPDSAAVYPWPAFFLVLIGNGFSYGAACKLLQLFFTRMAHKLVYEETLAVEPSRAARDHRVSGDIFEVENL